MPAGAAKPGFTLRRLGAADAAAFRDLRLLGLRRHPEAFGAAFEEEAGRPLAWFAGRLEVHAVWGGWQTGAGPLAGVVGLQLNGVAKARHKGVLWGMLVRPEARGGGLATALAGALLEHARSHVEEVRLSVGASNPAAIRLYARLGFSAYGVEPRALKLGEAYCDEVLMALRF
ncbi:GNAT family N-acetyltransferase [Paeniroseomonas aquatica]